jgi:hypothetical protein
MHLIGVIIDEHFNAVLQTLVIKQEQIDDTYILYQRFPRISLTLCHRTFLHWFSLMKQAEGQIRTG